MADPNARGKSALIRRTAMAAGLALTLIAGVWAWNYVSVQAPMREVLASDDRNAGIEVRVHYKMYLNPRALVFDLRDVPRDKAPIDVFRVFLQYAHALKGERFDRVELAFRGQTKFALDGGDFREIGLEFGDQNPMYTVRTFAEKLRTPDGRPAYERWEGGLLGVAEAQMQDFNDFQVRWYIEDL